MARHIGQCSKCGDAAHPKGNVFRIMSAVFFECDYGTEQLAGITTQNVKVCNNCNTPHPFHQRTSARAKKLQATMDWLLAQSD